jgi:DNA-binding transcriptional LysR family regulator
LVEVLANHPPPDLPVHILYAPTRQLSPRLRLFIDGAADRLSAQSSFRRETAAPA